MPLVVKTVNMLSNTELKRMHVEHGSLWDYLSKFAMVSTMDIERTYPLFPKYLTSMLSRSFKQAPKEEVDQLFTAIMRDLPGDDAAKNKVFRKLSTDYFPAKVVVEQMSSVYTLDEYRVNVFLYKFLLCLHVLRTALKKPFVSVSGNAIVQKFVELFGPNGTALQEFSLRDSSPRSDEMNEEAKEVVDTTYPFYSDKQMLVAQMDPEKFISAAVSDRYPLLGSYLKKRLRIKGTNQMPAARIHLWYLSFTSVFKTEEERDAVYAILDENVSKNMKALQLIIESEESNGAYNTFISLYMFMVCYHVFHCRSTEQESAYRKAIRWLGKKYDALDYSFQFEANRYFGQDGIAMNSKFYGEYAGQEQQITNTAVKDGEQMTNTEADKTNQVPLESIYSSDKHLKERVIALGRVFILPDNALTPAELAVRKSVFAAYPEYRRHEAKILLDPAKAECVGFIDDAYQGLLKEFSSTPWRVVLRTYIEGDVVLDLLSYTKLIEKLDAHGGFIYVSTLFKFAICIAVFQMQDDGKSAYRTAAKRLGISNNGLDRIFNHDTELYFGGESGKCEPVNKAVQAPPETTLSDVKYLKEKIEAFGQEFVMPENKANQDKDEIQPIVITRNIAEATEEYKTKVMELLRSKAMLVDVSNEALAQGLAKNIKANIEKLTKLSHGVLDIDTIRQVLCANSELSGVDLKFIDYVNFDGIGETHVVQLGKINHVLQVLVDDECSAEQQYGFTRPMTPLMVKQALEGRNR